MNNRITRANMFKLVIISVITTLILLIPEFYPLNFVSEITHSINHRLNELIFDQACSFVVTSKTPLYQVNGSYYFLISDQVIQVDLKAISVSIVSWLLFPLIFLLSPHCSVVTRLLMIPVSALVLFLGQANLLAARIIYNDLAHYPGPSLRSEPLFFLYAFAVLLLLSVIIEKTAGYIKTLIQTRHHWDFLTWVDHVEYWLNEKV